MRKLYEDYGVEHLIIPENDRYTEHISAAAEELGISCDFYNIDGGFSLESCDLSVTPVHYFGMPRGCTVKFGKAFYASGKTSNIVINSTIPVFLYGSFSKVSESAVTPVENTHLAVIPNDVKEAMFFESEFEEYRNRVNVRVFNNITTVDMKSFSE